MNFLMICDYARSTGRGKAEMLLEYRVNLSDVKDFTVFKKIDTVYFDYDEDRLPSSKVDEYLQVEKKILEVNPDIVIFFKK